MNKANDQPSGQGRQPGSKKVDSLEEGHNSNANQHEFQGDEFRAFYDGERKDYMIPNAHGGWIRVNETSLKLHLRKLGFSRKIDNASGLSEIDQALIHIRTKYDIAYAGRLAGHDSGLHLIETNSVLVTESPTLIKPKLGKWPTLSAMMEGMFNDGDFDQRPILWGWLKVAIESLRAHDPRPGQALALSGPPDSGKSLVQNLITDLLGGRSAKPNQYMQAATAFNKDLFEAEHLMLDDEVPSIDLRARRRFGTNIKNITVNEVQRCHAKHQNAISLKPFWRLTISTNDEPENLMVLPPMDDSIKDKIILLKVHKQSMPMPTESLEEWRKFKNTLLAELPAFAHFLLGWEIPSELRSKRFGIKHYHDPTLLRALNALAPESQLLSIIDDTLFKHAMLAPFKGSATDLERALKGGLMAADARRILNYNTACGVYLGRLMKLYPDRISYKHTASKRVWTIHPLMELVAQPVTGIPSLHPKSARNGNS